MQRFHETRDPTEKVKIQPTHVVTPWGARIVFPNAYIPGMRCNEIHNVVGIDAVKYVYCMHKDFLESEREREGAMVNLHVEVDFEGELDIHLCCANRKSLYYPHPWMKL
jgi:hypothetical protein